MVRFGMRGRRLAGVLGAFWGRHGVPWGAPGCLLGPLLVPEKRAGRLLNVLKTMHFTRCFGVFVSSEYFATENATSETVGGDLESLESLLGASWVLLVTVLVPQKASWGRTGAS